MAQDFLWLGPNASRATLVLAHGAGAAMDAPGMTALAESIARHNLRVLRFEFAYMAARRSGGSRKPPPRAEKLIPEYQSVLQSIETSGPVFIGGKSMGGRVASMIAGDAYGAGQIKGLFCIGYPFHPPGKADNLRTAHLTDLKTPTLICQGARDPFGTFEEVPSYDLSPDITVRWFEDGDHDLKPRKRISGFSHADHIETLGVTIANWVDSIIT